jgi:hypothetical protein
LLSSEAQDGQIKQRAINDGITGQDRLGFCVLQSLPQLIKQSDQECSQPLRQVMG